jgi:hypothetical protein
MPCQVEKTVPMIAARTFQFVYLRAGALWLAVAACNKQLIFNRYQLAVAYKRYIIDTMLC